MPKELLKLARLKAQDIREGLEKAHGVLLRDFVVELEHEGDFVDLGLNVDREQLGALDEQVHGLLVVDVVLG